MLERDREQPDLGWQRALTTMDPLAVCSGLRHLASLTAQRRIGSGVLRTFHDPADQSIPDVQECPKVYDEFPSLLHFALEHSVAVQGEAGQPGLYPVTNHSPMSYLLASAGGITAGADPQNLELTRADPTAAVAREEMPLSMAMAQATVSPGDVVRVNPREVALEPGAVTLKGEVRRPGIYAIRRGERLSDLLARAGGLTETAYPEAAVFTREAVRKKEQESYRLAARELESGLAQALEQQTSAEQQASIQVAETLLKSLRNAEASGRVVVEADPVRLQVEPELDTVLHVGDSLFIPKRPNHVMVSGEVLHPSAIRHRASWPADDYIQRAGGMRQTADEERAFVVLPNGEAVPLSVSFWNYRETQIPPGSTIVVPPDLSPFSFWTVAKDLTQVFSQVAISAASLAVINR